MAKRTGPIRRVRNRRNVDISAVPTPYPVLRLIATPYYSGGTSISVDLMANPATPVNGDLISPDMDFSEVIINGNGSAVSWVQDEVDAHIWTLEFPSIVDVGQVVVFPAWSQKLRFLDGAWLQPAMFTAFY